MAISSPINASDHGRQRSSSERADEAHPLGDFQADQACSAAVDKESKAYATSYYAVTMNDCVSFTADLARDCGMKVPAVNMSPDGFLQTLKFWNPPKSSGRATSSFWTW